MQNEAKLAEEKKQDEAPSVQSGSSEHRTSVISRSKYPIVSLVQERRKMEEEKHKEAGAWLPLPCKGQFRLIL